MDFLPENIRAVAELLLQILAVIGGSSVAAAWLPKGDGPVRKILDWLAQNYGNAKNVK